MRRIALLVFAVLALPASAQASTTCADFTYHGYDAVGIQDVVGMGCGEAHGLIRRVIEHGSGGALPCTHSFLPHDVTLWRCSGSEHGHKSRLEFGVRPTIHAFPAPTAPVTTCASLSAGGYRAQNIREAGLGCTEAHHLVRNVIAHGGSRHRHIACRVSYPRDVITWSCAGQVREHGITLTFYLKQTDPRVG
jgi:hypothetical protein